MAAVQSDATILEISPSLLSDVTAGDSALIPCSGLIPPSSAQSGCYACFSVTEGCAVTNFVFLLQGLQTKRKDWLSGYCQQLEHQSLLFTTFFFFYQSRMFNRIK